MTMMRMMMMMMKMKEIFFSLYTKLNSNVS
jgi:hypothetical protein